jgi:hypothetical protein
MWSNERKHDIYFEDFKGLGGGYLGVGGDQNYTMAAAAGSQVLWLVDIDLEVVKLHKLYSALLRATDTPQAFVALFERKGVPLVDAALAAPGAPNMTNATDTGTFNNDDITNDTTPDFDITCVNGSSVELWIDGVATGVTSVCTGGTETLTPSVALSGSPSTVYSITAKQTDPATNVSVTSGALAITIDTDAPTAPTGTPNLDAGELYELKIDPL